MDITVGKKLPYHSDWAKIEKRWKFWEASVKVNEDYVDSKDSRGYPIIKQWDCESRRNYKNRLTRTSPRNYIANIINLYNGSVFRNEPERDAALSDFIEDADGRGSSLNTIMSTTLVNTLVYGFSLTLLENNIGGSLSVAQAKLNNEEPRIVNIDPWSLINWKILDGFLLEALITFVDQNGTPFARYYNRDNVRDIFFNEKGVITGLGEELPHGFSDIPLALSRLSILSNSFIEPLAQTQMHINNLLSLLGTELYSQTYTRWLISGMDGISQMTKEEREQLTLELGSNELLIVPEQVNVSRMSSDVSQSAAIRDTIKEDTDELNKAASLGEAVATDSSGEARALARENFKTTASLMSSSIESAENYIIRLIGEITSRDYEKSYYSRQYQEPDYKEDVLELRDLLSLDIGDEIKQKAVENFRITYFAT